MLKKLFIALIAAAAVAALVWAIPTFIRARSTPSSAACINNLRLIQGGKDQWALENHKTTNDVPTWDDLRVYIGRSGTTGPVVTCPSGGTYSLGRVGQNPTCAIGGPSHSLPD